MFALIKTQLKKRRLTITLSGIQPTTETMEVRSPVPRARRNRKRGATSFSGYLSFGVQTSLCVGVFLFIYGLLLLVISPLLQQAAPKEVTLRRGQVLQPVMDHIEEKLKQLPHVPGQEVAGEAVEAMKKKLNQFRHRLEITDEHLMEKAAKALDNIRKNRKEEGDKKNTVIMNPAPVAPGKRTGFMVLGMHRYVA
jgi:hypothetical protein